MIHVHVVLNARACSSIQDASTARRALASTTRSVVSGMSIDVSAMSLDVFVVTLPCLCDDLDCDVLMVECLAVHVAADYFSCDFLHDHRQ